MRLRNIGIIAHVDAGKTTLTEAMLKRAGAIRNVGSVDGGSTVTDYDPQEQAKGITIQSAAVRFDWRGHIVNLIDTPGHADFGIEVERSLRVLDGAVVVLDAVSGVQPQTEKVWRQADQHRVPRIGFINKIDRPGACVDFALSSLQTRLNANAVLAGYPSGDHWVDLASGNFEELSRAARFEATEYRDRLLEACATHSDEIAEAWLEERSISREAIVACIREATLKGCLLPVLAGSAINNAGVSPLLDAVVDYLPEPSVRAPGGSLSAFCFKLNFLDYGALAFIRVYGGLFGGDSGCAGCL